MPPSSVTDGEGLLFFQMDSGIGQKATIYYLVVRTPVYVIKILELRAFIRSQPHGITEFDETLVKHLVERVTVFGDYLVFRLKSGVEVVVEK